VASALTKINIRNKEVDAGKNIHSASDHAVTCSTDNYFSVVS